MMIVVFAMYLVTFGSESHSPVFFETHVPTGSRWRRPVKVRNKLSQQGSHKSYCREVAQWVRAWALKAPIPSLSLWAAEVVGFVTYIDSISSSLTLFLILFLFLIFCIFFQWTKKFLHFLISITCFLCCCVDQRK